MAERSRPPPLWALFDRLSAELQRAIVELLCAAAEENLRLACTSARALLNSRVARIALPAGQLIGRPLRLHERFPRLKVLALLDAPGRRPHLLTLSWTWPWPSWRGWPR
jgi:hypothetical protein